jgi:RNA polymerase sigma-70 factor, ECF subfamily
MEPRSQEELERLLRVAQQGDEAAFVALVKHLRDELHRHCYRMLGSPDDADDAVQEALLRAWKALPRFRGESSVRTWLFKITTNTALDVASARRRRDLPVDFSPPNGSRALGLHAAPEVAWIGPYPTTQLGVMPQDPEASLAARETIELAYVAALQHLPAHQRAVFILREVLSFRASEVADILDSTVPAVNSLLQRARASVAEHAPASQAEELRKLGDAGVRELATRYARAIEDADIEALMELVTQDVSWSMPPVPSWFQGRESVSGFLRENVFAQRWRHVFTSANGQLAVAGYIFDAQSECFVACALDVLSLRDGLVDSVTGFLTPFAMGLLDEEGGADRLFGRFGLAERLDA